MAATANPNEPILLTFHPIQPLDTSHFMWEVVQADGTIDKIRIEFGLQYYNDPLRWSEYCRRLQPPTDKHADEYDTLTIPPPATLFTPNPLHLSDVTPADFLASFHDYVSLLGGYTDPSNPEATHVSSYALLPQATCDLTLDQLYIIWAFHHMPPIAWNYVSALVRLDYDVLSPGVLRDTGIWSYLYTALLVYHTFLSPSAKRDPAAGSSKTMTVAERAMCVSKLRSYAILPFVQCANNEPGWVPELRIERATTFVMHVLDEMHAYEAQFRRDMILWLHKRPSSVIISDAVLDELQPPQVLPLSPSSSSLPSQELHYDDSMLVVHDKNRPPREPAMFQEVLTLADDDDHHSYSKKRPRETAMVEVISDDEDEELLPPPPAKRCKRIEMTACS